MTFSDEILSPRETAALTLRELFLQHGYSRYEMNKFEEYELYASHRAVLAGEDIITFTGAGGKLMALRPDVTLSIVKNTKNLHGTSRLFYHENVYRRAGLGREFKERLQVGLECIGEVGDRETSEVIALAAMSLQTLGVRTFLDVSHLGFLGALLDEAGISDDARSAILRRIGEKNEPGLRKLADEIGLNAATRAQLTELMLLYGEIGQVFGDLRALGTSERTAAAADELERVAETAFKTCPAADIRLDFSIVNDMHYYNGIIFQVYAEGAPRACLSGGRYDSLMRRFGSKANAVGFSVYLDMVGRRGNND